MQAPTTHLPSRKSTVKPQKPAATDSIHGDFLEQTIPQWLTDASPQRRQALKKAGTVMPDWYRNALPAQRKKLDERFAASARTQFELDKTMSGFKDIDAFAEPLLRNALKEQFAVEVDVNKTLLCLRRPLEIGLLEIELSSFDVLKLPMLQATLHNFEAYECKAGAYHKTSGFIVESATPGTFEAVSLNLSVSQFMTLCRTLDIGAKYQAYLKSFFNPADAQANGVLRQHFVASQKAALGAAAEQALLSKDIEPKDHAMILSVINGEVHPWMGNKQVWFEDFALMKKRLTGCVVFSICEKYRYSDELILYIPHDPHHPLKRYSYAQLREDFKRLLTARDASDPGDGTPTPYQRFLGEFIAYDQRPYYFSQFTQKAADSPGNPLRSPWISVAEFIQPLSSITKIKELPPEAPAKMEPASDPYIAPSTARPKGKGMWAENDDLWTRLYQNHCDKVLADARSHAVPTDDVDVKARDAKLAHLLQIGLVGLNLVTMFVPVLGEIMMVAMAGQLLYETLEGAVEWGEGDKRAAKAHLIDVAENLALIGVMAGVGAGFAKLTAIRAEPVIEDLHQVTLPNGETRLWKPDLSAYESGVKLPASPGPNAAGQHLIQGDTYIRMGDKVYEQVFDPSMQKWRITHPTDPHAYQPILESNGQGAWRHALERPMQWDRLTLLRRMGHKTAAVSDETLLKAADISGVTDSALRKMHLDNAAPPPELIDALRLLNANAAVSQVIEQLRGVRAVDEDYLSAVPLVTQMPRWPEGRMLKVFKAAERTGDSVQYGVRGLSRKPSIRVSEAQVLGGELPASILAALDEAEITRLLGGEGARVRDLRLQELRKQLADFAETRQPAIFERLYTGSEPVDSRIATLQRECPGLSETGAQAVIAHAREQDLQRLDARQRTPLKMLEEARWYAAQGRQTRAFAGLHTENIATAGSRKLALHALGKLPGWPDTVRLEVRDGSPSGALLDSVGAADAASTKYLVKDGPRYQAFNERGEALNSVPVQGDNFYASIMHALPDEARSSLGLPAVSQSAELQLQVSDSATRHRTEAVTVLEPQANGFKPPVRVNERLLGYYASGRGRALNPSLTSRVEALYPGPPQADAFIRQHQGLSDAQIYNVLQTRSREWQSLNTTLDQWLGAPGSAAHRDKLRFAEALKSSWRNAPLADQLTDAGVLKFDCDELLPSLDMDFPHVHELELDGAGVTDANANEFLLHFPNLRKLLLSGRRWRHVVDVASPRPLTTLPLALGDMRELTNLWFISSDNELSAEFATRLGKLTSLEDLRINHRGFSKGALNGLDLSGLTRLKRIRIEAAHSLSQWPAGVENLAHLERLDLTYTAIARLPEAVFNGHEKLWAAMSLDWSKFSYEAFKPAYEYVKNYTGPLGHLSDANRMVGEYCRGEIGFLTGGAANTGPLLERIITTWDTPETRLAAVQALSVEHAGIFRQFNEPSANLGLRGVSRPMRWLLGHGSHVISALENSWRAAIYQRYGLEADATIFELKDPEMQMSELFRSVDSTDLPRLPANSFPKVRTVRINWKNTSAEQLRDFLKAFGDAQTLELGGNALTELPISPDDFTALSRLDLHDNAIAVTPEVQAQFNGLATVEYLNLANNPLNQLDVSALTQIKALNLRSTKLKAWPTGAENLPALDWLDVRDNEMTSLTAPALADEHVLLKVNLTGNPLSAEAENALAAARQRIELAKGLSEGSLQRFGLQEVPPEFPPTESGWSMLEHLLPLPESSPVSAGDAGFVQRLQQMNPTMTDDLALQRIEQLRSDGLDDAQIEGQLSEWHKACEHLTQQLNGWTYTREVRTPTLTVSSESRQFAALRLQELWQEGLNPGAGLADRELSLNGLQTGDFPDLGAQFPHVTTLDLTGTRITAQGSNGFLQAFPRLKRLILNGNTLTEVPQALLQMSELSQLELAANQLADADLLYRSLDGLPLRSLDLSHNRLGRFDTATFSQLETLNLGYNVLRDWPDGALEAEHLSTLNLDGNPITELPVNLLDGSHDRLLSGTRLAENSELSYQALEELRDYSDDHAGSAVAGIERSVLDSMIADLEREEASSSEGDSDSDDSDDSGGPPRRDSGAVVQPVEPLYQPGLDTSDLALEPWLANTRADLANLRREIWGRLAGEDNHERFFQLVSLLRGTDEFRFVRADLTRRLWEVMNAAAENTELRDLLFLNAESHGTCIDGRILTFSEMEVRVFVYHALRSIAPGQPLLRGRALLRLSRQLFRLDRVETLAEAAAVRRDRAEVRLQYRIGLTSGWPDGTVLPGQPAHMAFATPISGQRLIDARASILEAENSDAFLRDLTSRDYWTTYLEERYPDDMTAIQDAIDDERERLLGDLEDRQERGEITDDEYQKEIVGLGRKTQATREQKLLELSRREVNTLTSGTTEASPASPQPGPSRLA